MLRFISALVCGLLFGLGMAISGMVDPNIVLGFLDIAGQWNPDLIFVLGGAILVFMPGYFLFIKPRETPITGLKFAYSNKRIIDKPLVIGAAIFGLGWGIAGICPGPVVSSLTANSADILLFIGAILAGQYGVKRLG